MKRIVGLPGDHVDVEGPAVCVGGECRVLLRNVVERGAGPLAEGVIPKDQYAVFGDAADSLDSRYDVIGLIDKSSIQAVGFPIAIPHCHPPLEGDPFMVLTRMTLAFLRSTCTGLLGAVALATAPALAEDFGTHGPVWEISEPSLLDVIKARLQEMEEAGDLARMQQEMQDTTRAYVARPRPVFGLIKAVEEHVFEIDLSITVSRDLMDHEGRVFAPAGTVINPLNYSLFNKRIVFLNGDDTAQVSFALSEGNELDTLLVLTNGAPLDLMREHGRRFYFDQDAVMVNRFQITALPSEVMRASDVMLVREVPVGEAQ